MTFCETDRRTRALLAGLDIEDRLALLLFAIIREDGDALNVTMRLTNAVMQSTKDQPIANRSVIAAALRDVADRLVETPADIGVMSQTLQ